MRQGVVTKVFLCFGLFLNSHAFASQAVEAISTLDNIKDEFQAVPCKNEDREQAVKDLFEKMGAPAAEVRAQDYKNVTNIVIQAPGMGDGIIVIGAHYDKASEGCGALDNWSGIVAIAHVYRSLKAVPLTKTVLFVAFGKEEQGLVGSRAMADSINKSELTQYCAMINVDSLGLGPPQVMDNTSSDKLETLAWQIARDMKMPFSHAPIANGDADSSSFLRKNIPSVTIHGMSDEWQTLLHSAKDQPAKVNPTSVYLGYRLVLAFVQRLDPAKYTLYR